MLQERQRHLEVADVVGDQREGDPPAAIIGQHESRRRQYALAERARILGWTSIEVIDDDLGRSGSGTARPGFEKLLAAICEGRVGAVMAIKASRLARNGRDWHTLLEFCGLVGTLIADEDGLYDSRHPNHGLAEATPASRSVIAIATVRVMRIFIGLPSG